MRSEAFCSANSQRLGERLPNGHRGFRAHSGGRERGDGLGHPLLAAVGEHLLILQAAEMAVGQFLADDVHNVDVGVEGLRDRAGQCDPSSPVGVAR